MKIYVKEQRTLDGKTYPSGWHEVDRETAYEMLCKFRLVCRLPRKKYGEGREELGELERET